MIAETSRDVVGSSYRHAWGYLRRAEMLLGAPLIETRPVTGRARGIQLTIAARAVLLAAPNGGMDTITPRRP